MLTNDGNPPKIVARQVYFIPNHVFWSADYENNIKMLCLSLFKRDSGSISKKNKKIHFLTFNPRPQVSPTVWFVLRYLF